MMPLSTSNDITVSEKMDYPHSKGILSPCLECSIPKNQPKEVSKKQKVRWYPKVKLYLMDSSLESDYDSIWYSPEDYARFKEESRRTIETARQRNIESGFHSDSWSVMHTSFDATITGEKSEPNQNEVATRGLEHFICNERKHLRYHRRKKSIQAVWDEQVRQWQSFGDVTEPHKIAKVYSKLSRSAQIQAQIQGYTYYIENNFEECCRGSSSSSSSSRGTSSKNCLGDQMPSPPSPMKMRKKQVASPLA